MAERKLEKLKCYACNGKVRQMCYPCNEEVCQINSCQFYEWKARYKKDLESYISSDVALLDVRQHYSDPDTSYCKGRDHSFFCDLVKFLNKREKEMKERFPKSLQGSFKYRFTEDEGIEVSGTDSEGKKIQPFYLRSDQFGFSAPVNKKCYPYDLYIVKHENKDEAIKKVIKWISMSRTIGGSFLWPRPFYDKYNPQRGGTITYNSRRYYIQDRVDLTLWEIKNWYGVNDILKRCSTEENFGHWMGHFKDFKTYVTYFMFNQFVSSDGLYNPINIITGESDAPVRGPHGENPKPAITASMKFAILEKMLDRLNDKIVKRSIKMTEIIDKENRDG